MQKKYIPYYIRWVQNGYSFLEQNHDTPLSKKQQAEFLKHMAKTHEEWQVKQADTALRHYSYFLSLKGMNHGDFLHRANNRHTALIEEFRKSLRLRHRSYSTEKSYVFWLRSFLAFLEGNSLESLAVKDIQNFLSYLAVERSVSPSTQNQALNALIYFFRNVLDKNIGNDEIKAVRARRKARLPVVLSQAEVQNILSFMSGVTRLMAMVVYGCGLRLTECLRLRVKDVDLERGMVIVRSGKGDKDRRTVLPEMVKSDLIKQIAYARELFLTDRERNTPGVELPGALERKYPNAGKEWGWFWLFPSKTLSVDPRSGKIRRHHIHPVTLQKAFKKAMLKTGIPKQASVHSLRHSFATHLLENGYDIRTIQELLGHRKLETTMIYTHVVKKNVLGVRSPLDS